MRKLFFLGFAAMVGMGIISLSSCTKDGADGMDGLNGKSGVDGQNGTNGMKGDTGLTGPQGNTGPQGTPGSANLRSKTITVTSIDWIYDEITKQHMAFIVDDDMTTDVLDNGLVQVFIKSGEGRYSALPATYYPSPNVAYKTGFSLTRQLVRIEIQSADLKQSDNPGMITFKIVAMGREFAMIHPNVNTSDYSQLSAFLNAADRQ